MAKLALFILLISVAYSTAVFDSFFGGGDDAPARPAPSRNSGGNKGGSSAGGQTKPGNKNCVLVYKKDKGAAGKTVDTAGRGVGSVFGGGWGAIMPQGAVSGALKGATGDSSEGSAGSDNPLTGTAGFLVGSAWRAVVPNSVRCGSIQAAKSTSGIGKSQQDKDCANTEWVDKRNGNRC